MKGLEFERVVTAKLDGKIFTNPKGVARQYAKCMLHRNTSIMRYYTKPGDITDFDWATYRLRTNAYMKRAKRRLLPIFKKEMDR